MAVHPRIQVLAQWRRSVVLNRRTAPTEWFRLSRPLPRARVMGYDAPRHGQNLDTFISKWAASGAAERANKDMFLAELCSVLGVAPPNPATGDAEKDTYVFERASSLAHEGGDTTTATSTCTSRGASFWRQAGIG